MVASVMKAKLRRGEGLSVPQIRILKLLAAHDEGMTRGEIQEAMGTISLAENLGPHFKDDIADCDLKFGKPSLWSLKLVKPIPDQREGKDVLVYVLTEKGQKAAAGLEVRKPMESSHKIAREFLDAAVLKVKSQRAYGLELYTDEDVAEIRELCGPAYSEVPLDSIRHQMVNRRKQNAYSDPAERRQRPIKQVLSWFGEKGSVEPGLLTSEQVEHLRSLLDA